MRTKTHILRSVANNGNKCKVYYYALNTEEYPKHVVMMKVMVLTTSPENTAPYVNPAWIYERNGVSLICYYQAMQLSSMGTIFNTLNTEINNVQ